MIQQNFVNMKKYKVLFCDLDGTLIETVSGKTFPKGIWDMKLKLDVLDVIKKMKPEFVFIVTNQGGIEKGIIDESDFEYKIEYIRNSIRCYTESDVDYDYCSINDKTSIDRKPNPGMVNSFIAFYELNKEDCLMIGDASGLPGQFSDSDKKCAENAGIDYMDVSEFLKL